MKYKYEDMPDKSMEGMKKELQEGLTVAAVFFHQTHGIPLGVFNSWLEEMPNMAAQMAWYMNFRNKYPKLFA